MSEQTQVVVPIDDAHEQAVQMATILEGQVESLHDTEEIIQNIQRARLRLSQDAFDERFSPDQRMRILRHFSEDGVLSAQHQQARRQVNVQIAPPAQITDEEADAYLDE